MPESASRLSPSSLLDRLSKFRTLGVVAAWLAAITITTAAFAFAIPTLKARADAARPDGDVEIHFTNAPSWLREEDLAPIASLVRDQLNGCAFDRDGLRVAADALRACGWFETVIQVRRTSLNRVEVDGAWVEPFALVRDRDADHLVDQRGRLLPRSYMHGTAPAFVRIENCRAARPAVFGTAWSGADVAAALALVRAIDERPWRPQVTAIDVSTYSVDGSLSLRTTRDAIIRWGHAPGEGSAAEVPTAQRLQYLQFLHDSYGRIDAFGQGQLDLTADYVGTRK